MVVSNSKLTSVAKCSLICNGLQINEAHSCSIYIIKCESYDDGDKGLGRAEREINPSVSLADVRGNTRGTM